MEQRTFGILGEIPPMDAAPIEAVMSWKEEKEAVQWLLHRLFRHRPGLTLESVADYIGVAKGTMTKIAQGQLGLSGQPRTLFQQLCGVPALEQFQLKNFGYVATDARKKVEQDRSVNALKIGYKQIETENKQLKKMFSSSS